MKRRYFIMDRSKAQPDDEFTALELCIGANDTQRYSLDGTKLLIKTNQSNIDQLLVEWGNQYTWEQILELTFSVEYTLDDIQILLNGPDWTDITLI